MLEKLSPTIQVIVLHHSIFKHFYCLVNSQIIFSKPALNKSQHKDRGHISKDGEGHPLIKDIFEVFNQSDCNKCCFVYV